MTEITCADLIKADTPLTTAKISRMLHQLDFKLTVEKQYKEGIDKMAKLYQVTRLVLLSGHSSLKALYRPMETRSRDKMRNRSV